MLHAENSLGAPPPPLSLHKRGLVGAAVCHSEHAHAHPKHSSKTHDSLKALEPTTTIKKGGIESWLGMQECYMLKTHQELLLLHSLYTREDKLELQYVTVNTLMHTQNTVLRHMTVSRP